MTKTDVLSKCTVDGMVVKLPNIDLDRSLYLEVAKSLSLIGGKWKGGKVGGFVFSSDPTELLLNLQGVDNNDVSLNKKFQYYPTPSIIVDKLISLAEISDTDTILEPSVGQGAILKGINAVTSVIPDCYELMDINRRILSKSGYKFNLIGNDFMECDNNKKYTKIIANPPFRNNQDINHLMRMYSKLEDGGRLVCITSESWCNNSQKKHVAFREWLSKLSHQVLDIDAGSFKESGAMVGGKIVIINK